jgi:ACS family hexuronate transporter-like MFS transporter
VPREHPRLSPEELAYIEAGQSAEARIDGPPVSWGRLLRYKQTWGIVLGRALLDPYWFMIADWFALYLSSKGFRLEQSVVGFWAPFLGADLGNFFGGGLSSWLIARGWSVGRSRRFVLAVFGPTMLALIPAVYVSNYVLMIGLFTWATFAYAACSTMFLSFPADVFATRAVASVSGLSGTGAGLCTLLSTYLIGRIADRYSFAPIIVTASIVPCVATAIFLTMVRARKRPDPAGLVVDF